MRWNVCRQPSTPRVHGAQLPCGNWSCAADTPAQTEHAYRSLQAFTSAWDLDLDSRKLKRPSGRTPLGAHVRMSPRRTNFTQTVRIRAMESRWSRLEASLAPYHRKVGALKSAGWPRALHGISNVHLGESQFALLRSGAMRGIGSKMPGANPIIHLSLVEFPLADPAFVALRKSFLDARRLASIEYAAPVLDEMARAPVPPITGPLAILLVRANDVGLSWCVETKLFRDTFGCFDAWQCSPQELDLRLCWAWQQFASARAQHRRSFHGLTAVDPALSRRVVARLSPADRAAIRVARNGTFFTQDTLRHIREGETPHCAFCGELDSIRHRVYMCPHFQAARTNLEVPADALSQLEDFQALHAWGRRPPMLQEYLLALCQPFPTCHAAPHSTSALDLFTDGSCLDPRQHETRVASWAVVQGCVGFPPKVVGSGPLQGLVQTAYRAEITAVLHAFSLADALQRPTRIWSDCQGVVLRARKLLANTWRPKPSNSNYDLWLELAELCTRTQNLVRIFKVAAHDDGSDYEPAVNWILHHNMLADEAANDAHELRGNPFWTLWRQLREALILEEKTARALVRLHSAVAAIAVRTPSRSAPQCVPAQRDDAPQDRPFSLPIRSAAFAGLERRFSSEYVESVFFWYDKAFNNPAAQAASVRWISVLQLFMDYVATTGQEPVQYDSESRTWILPSRRTAALVIEVDVPLKLRWFLQSLKGFARAAGCPLVTRETRPYSSTVLARCQCIAARLAPSRVLVTDGWLARGTRTGVLLRNRDWRKAPSPIMSPALR